MTYAIHSVSTAPVPGFKSARLLHTMLRVGDLDRSIAFYTRQFGMTLFRTERHPQGRFTLAFVGYGSEKTSAVIEFTHNWDPKTYQPGTGYGHIALAVRDAAAACDQLEARGVKIIRKAGPMTFCSSDRSNAEVIAFVEDPDGYRIELIECA